MTRVRSLGRVVTLVAVLGLILALVGCTQLTVKVRTGERVVGSDGTVIREDIRTVEVPADQASRYGIKVTVVDMGDFAAVYAVAQKLLASGTVDAARPLLERVERIRPGYRSTTKQLAAIKAGTTPKPDTGAPTTGTGTGGSTAKPPVKPPVAGTPAGLASWIPTDIAGGYRGRTPDSDEIQTVRAYDPPGTALASSLVIVVKDLGDPNQAAATRRREVEAAYPSDRWTGTVAGRKAYYGTDSRKFAVLAVTDGGLLVTLEAGARTGAPGGLKGELVRLAGLIGR
jgi:hypothetical protein